MSVAGRILLGAGIVAGLIVMAPFALLASGAYRLMYIPAESMMPTFDVGDKLVMRAVAHNTTTNGGKAEVFFQTDETARASDSRRHIDLPAGASVAIDIPIEIVAAGNAQWKWGIKCGDNSDAVEAEIHIANPAP